MRARLLLGAAAVALSLAPAASATHSCAQGLETLCDVQHLVQNLTCNPKLNPC
ncbi:MAG TPA: hypothetical protein VGX28_01900 [Frankiaceae bacterium]|jgi:hypothetical protein|nr:hypothetical protein [Frankiaceae bacterium]